MALNITVTANEAFADGGTVDRAALRRAAKPTVSITGAVSAAEVGDETVNNAKLAHMAANTVKVRDAGTPGDPSDKAVADTQILIGDSTGFTAAALSGDVTMANTGAVTIASNSVEGSMLNDNVADAVTIERSGSGGTLSLKADSVGISHLADGTPGTLLSYDATGAVAAVGAGSKGQILTVQASGAPAFQANTGAMKLLAYSQSTVDHTPQSAVLIEIASTTLPANHGFSHIMIEVDARGWGSTGYEYSLHVGGSEVKTWPMPAGAFTVLEKTTVTTYKFITTDPTPTSDTAIAFNKKFAGTASNYDVTFFAWRIWGLTAPS